MDTPTIIMLPGGDAILATAIERVRFYPGHFDEALGQTWPDRVIVNGQDFAFDDADTATAARDSIIAQWRAAVDR